MEPSKLSIHQYVGDRVELQAGASAADAVYQFGGQPKPCVHPLTTPKGHVISGHQMSDHIWHRGLWFTIKFINSDNFWEENPPFGVQKSLADPLCRILASGAVRMTHEQDWTAPSGSITFHEKRTVETQFGDDGVTRIDFSTRLTAAQDLLLERTPFTTWGGYGGMSFRAARELHDGSFLTPNGETSTAIQGKPHDWVVLQGAMDGGKDERISIGMMDHPSNPRTQSPWYCRTANGATFMNAAFLFHEGLKVAKGETLKFRYRVLARDGMWTAQQFAVLATDFRQTRDESENA